MKWLSWIGGLLAATLPAQVDAGASASPAAPASVSQAREWFDAGRFDEAFAAWRQLAAEAADQPERQYNLALAAWRAGQLDAARDAIEKYAALARTPRVDLHRGLLGAIAFDEAKALAAAADTDPAQAQQSLADALAKATAAREHFVRGALGGGGAALRRNAERALRLEQELQKRLDELQKQAKEQQPEQQSQPGQEPSPQDQPKDGKSQDPQSGESKPSEPPSGEPSPDESQAGKPQSGAGESDPQQAGETNSEPSQGGEGKAGEPAGEPPPPPAEPKPGDPSSPPPAQPSQDGQGQSPQPATEPDPDGGDVSLSAPAGADAPPVPGEAPAGRLLSQEQQKRLLDMLQQLDRRQQALQARWKAQRPKVEKDW